MDCLGSIGRRRSGRGMMARERPRRSRGSTVGAARRRAQWQASEPASRVTALVSTKRQS
jgi:hypothetical protein